MFWAPQKQTTKLFARFLELGSKNRRIFNAFWTAPSKNTGIYAAFSILLKVFFPCKRQNHCKLQCFCFRHAPQTYQNQPASAQNGPSRPWPPAACNLFLTRSPWLSAGVGASQNKLTTQQPGLGLATLDSIFFELSRYLQDAALSAALRISLDEFVHGCMQLQGPAKGLQACCGCCVLSRAVCCVIVSAFWA